MGWPSERSKKEWAEEEEMFQALKKTKTIKPEYKLAQAQQPNIDEILKALLLEALNHTHSAATPQETFNMFYGSDSYREYKQAILAILAQEVKRVRIESLNGARARIVAYQDRPPIELLDEQINELRKAGLV